MLTIPKLGGLADWLSDVPDLTELAKGSTVWLAVTGLSRAARPVFITSLVHNLLSALHNPNRMPLLKAVGEGRLIAARLEGARRICCRAFPIRTISRRWPRRRPAGRSRRPTSARSASISASSRPGLIDGVLGRISGGAATPELRIVDYPGEWLLDLPLMSAELCGMVTRHDA